MSRLFNRDALAGLLFLVVGVAGLIISKDYNMGTPLRMGAGYFPRLLCWALIGVGGLIAVKGVIAGGVMPGRLYWRPLVCITTALVAFALLLPSHGLATAAAVVVFVGALGGPEYRTIEAVVLAVVLAGAAVGLFAYGLGMPFRILPF